MSEREEIRWRFQLIMKTIEKVSNSLEQERKSYEDFSEKQVRSTLDIRDRFLAGIGFGVTFFLMLIILEIFSKEWVLFSVIALIVGIVLFGTFNTIAYRNQEKVSKLLIEFRKLIDNKLELIQGNIIFYASQENISKQDIEIISKYVSIHTLSISLELGMYGYNEIKTGKPDKENFEKGYLLAIKMLDDFKKFNFFTGTERIEKFIKDFEDAFKK